MDILYEFDTIGIIYTAVVGGLFLLLFLPTILFAAKRKQTNPGTVFYRVLDIVLIVALAVLWFAYALCRVELFGLSVKPDGDALAFLSGGSALFGIPYIGGLHGIFLTVLGTVLLGLLSFMAVLSLIFSFALRRKKREEVAETSAEDAAETAPAAAEAVEAIAFAPVDEEPTDGQAEAICAENAESAPAVAEEQAAETAGKPTEEAVVDEEEASAPADEFADLVAVEVLDESEEFVPVEVLTEEAAPEEILTAEIQEDVPPKELSPEVKDAIRTVVLGTPQEVKDALKVVIEEDPFIVREVLRVIVETPAPEPSAAPAAERSESVVAATEKAAETVVLEITTDAPAAIAPESAPDAAEKALVGESEPFAVPDAAEAIAATTEEPEPAAVVRLFAHVSNKTYSSSVRRPDMKKRSASAAKNQA